MLSVVLLGVAFILIVMLSVIMLSDVTLGVSFILFVMLSVAILSVIMMNVVAPLMTSCFYFYQNRFFYSCLSLNFLKAFHFWGSPRVPGTNI
jgi:hypothetical protein